MGNRASSSSSASSAPVFQDAEGMTHVFGKELYMLNSILNNILTADGSGFKNKGYHFLDRKKCEDHMLVLESDLRKHVKMELAALNDSIYLVPRAEKDLVVGQNGQVRLTKNEICKAISTHYGRILTLIQTIKLVYDVENGGDYSIAGIAQRNFRMMADVFEIKYCAESQASPAASLPNQKQVEKVNMNDLKGFKVFIKNVLNRDEATRLTHHLSALLSRKNTQQLKKAICQNIIDTPETTAAIYKDDFPGLDCSEEPGAGAATRKKNHVITYFSVSKDNPVLSYNMCLDRRKLIIPLSKNKESFKKLTTLYERFRKNYIKNIQLISNVINQMVEFDPQTQTASLRFLDNEDVKRLTHQCKVYMMTFYIRSIVDYQRLLDMAKTMKPIHLNDDDV